MKRVRIPTELADAVAKVLRESQFDKEAFVRSTTIRLQQLLSFLGEPAVPDWIDGASRK